MGWWRHVVEERTRDWTFSPVGAPGAAVDAESAYLNVFLDSMRVVHIRKGLQRFYGTVSSYCALPHRSNGTAEFFVVNTPTHLKDASPSELARVLNLKTRLLGPVPYRGGDLQLQVGLFSIGAGDLSGPYLECSVPGHRGRRVAHRPGIGPRRPAPKGARAPRRRRGPIRPGGRALHHVRPTDDRHVLPGRGGARRPGSVPPRPRSERPVRSWPVNQCATSRTSS